MLVPIYFVDKNMRDLLMVPLERDSRDTINIIEIKEEDTHCRDNRLNVMKKELLINQSASKKKKRIVQSFASPMQNKEMKNIHQTHIPSSSQLPAPSIATTSCLPSNAQIARRRRPPSSDTTTDQASQGSPSSCAPSSCASQSS